MNLTELTQATQARLAAQGARPLPAGSHSQLLRAGLADQDCWLALAPDQPDAAGYLLAFEVGLQQLLTVAGQSPGQLVLVLAFEATASGVQPSYRRALKKYSNSVLFEDLGLQLWLARAQEWITLAPAQVNPFLRDLNGWIARQRPR